MGPGAPYYMSTSIEHVITNGRIYRRRIDYSEVRLTTEVVATLTADVQYQIPKICMHELGTVSVSVSGTHSYWSVRLSYLPLRCPFALTGSTLIPSPGGDRSTLMTMKWSPPKNMGLYFLCRCHAANESANINSCVDLCYLIAVSPDGNTWRLPLGNLYDDGRICMGQESFGSKNQLDCLNMALTQFSNSEWNTDLWKDKTATGKMFRFCPNDAGFDQMDVTGSWTASCMKIGVAITKHIVR